MIQIAKKKKICSTGSHFSRIQDLLNIYLQYKISFFQNSGSFGFGFLNCFIIFKSPLYLIQCVFYDSIFGPI